MPKQFTSDRPSVDEIIRRKRPNRRFVDILLDPTLYQAVELKKQELDRALKNEQRGRKALNEPAPATLQEQLDDLLDSAADESVVFVFQDIGKKRYDELEREYPPSAAQKEQWKEEGNTQRLAYNIEEFVPRLIASCSIELDSDEEAKWREEGGRGILGGKISVDQAKQIFDEWSEGDIEALFYGAVAACKERTSIPLSKRSIAPTPDSLSNSTTAPNGESPTVDS